VYLACSRLVVGSFPRGVAAGDPCSLSLTSHTHTYIQQEVDHYHDCLEPRMAALGYRGAFMQKPLNQDGRWNG
jgi:hypothetical protein